MCFSSLSFHSWSQRRKRSLQFSEHPSLSWSRLFMAIFSVNEKRESTSVQPVRASSLDYPHKTFSIRGRTGRWGWGVFHRLAVLEMPVPGAWGWLWGGNSLEWMRYGGSKVCLSIYFHQPEAYILPWLVITKAWAWSKPWPFPTFQPQERFVTGCSLNAADQEASHMQNGCERKLPPRAAAHGAGGLPSKQGNPYLWNWVCSQPQDPERSSWSTYV